MMNDICGIRAPFQGFGLLVDRIPRVLPWAGIGDTVGVPCCNRTIYSEDKGICRPEGVFYVSLGQRPKLRTQAKRYHVPTGQLYVSLGQRPKLTTKAKRYHAPTGQLYVSLGQRPRKSIPILALALKGRYKAETSGFRAPFQGFGLLVDRIPRVSPWAGIGDTVGVEKQRTLITF